MENMWNKTNIKCDFFPRILHRPVLCHRRYLMMMKMMILIGLNEIYRNSDQASAPV